MHIHGLMSAASLERRMLVGHSAGTRFLTAHNRDVLARQPTLAWSSTVEHPVTRLLSALSRFLPSQRRMAGRSGISFVRVTVFFSISFKFISG
jgi:hypothetical protein